MTKQQKAVQFMQAYGQGSPQALDTLLTLTLITNLNPVECLNRIIELAETGKCKEEF